MEQATVVLSGVPTAAGNALGVRQGRGEPGWRGAAGQHGGIRRPITWGACGEAAESLNAGPLEHLGGLFGSG